MEPARVEAAEATRNNTEDRLDYLEEMSKMSVKRSCQEMAAYGIKKDDFYFVDPDGPLVGSEPIRVFCDFSSSERAVTSVMHDSEGRMEVDKRCDEAG